jgi:hypothetical protein
MSSFPHRNEGLAKGGWNRGNGPPWPARRLHRDMRRATNHPLFVGAERPLVGKASNTARRTIDPHSVQDDFPKQPGRIMYLAPTCRSCLSCVCLSVPPAASRGCVRERTHPAPDAFSTVPLAAFRRWVLPFSMSQRMTFQLLGGSTVRIARGVAVERHARTIIVAVGRVVREASTMPQ